MAVAKKSDEQASDETLLADHHAAHFLGERLDPTAGFLDATIEFLNGWIHKSGVKILSCKNFRLSWKCVP